MDMEPAILRRRLINWPVISRKDFAPCIVKNAGFAFFLGATVVFPGEVFFEPGKTSHLF